MFTAKYLVAEIVPEIKGFNKTEFMNDCQLVTGSESPQHGQNNHYQIFVINSELVICKNSFSTIDCQLAAGSESPQLGGEQQHQLPHLLLHWKGALLAYDEVALYS